MNSLFRPTGLKLTSIITFSMVALYLWNFIGMGQGSFIELLDKKVVDFILLARGTQPTSGKIAIAVIDTKSVDQYGRWPWGRDLMAKLLHELTHYYGAKVIGYDVVFSEPDPNDQTTKKVLDIYHRQAMKLTHQPDKLKEVRQELAQKLSLDRQFAKELNDTNRVVGGYFFFYNKDNIQHLSAREVQSNDARVERNQITHLKGHQFLADLPLFEAKGVETNTDTLTTSNSLYGYFNVFPDFEDGTVRRVHLVTRYKGGYYPSLDLQVVRRHDTNRGLSLIANQGGIEAVKIGKRIIPTASDGSIMINYRGPAMTFPHYSVVDIIQRRVKKSALQNKIVLLGATEIGVMDLRTTPVGVAYPGVEVHANVIDNILQGDYFLVTDTSRMLSLVLILFIGLLTGWLVPKLRALSGAIFILSTLAVFWAANLYSLLYNQRWVSFVYLSLTLVLSWLAVTLLKYFGEEKDKRFIKSAFSQYLSPDVIDSLVENPALLKLGGEQREMTCIFSDIQGFSTISEGSSPEELVELLNEYLTEMTQIIQRHGGTVDKFEGDAIIAFFGAPLQQPDHALQACRAVIEMQVKGAEMRAQQQTRGKHELHTRIGVNTGLMVVGNMGSAQRMDYTIMGDAVNLAARLEGVNKEYKTYSMISQHTRQAIGEALEVRELDAIRVVGKSEPVRIFELLGKRGEVAEETLQAHRYYLKGLRLYRKKKFAEAKKYFAQCIKLKKEDGPSLVLLNRCKTYEQAPPKNWDGIYHLTVK